ncbi:hypothetical protein AWOD_II_1044 [Aliivibrio wodanis]|uniref:Uncharacterized protein n=1 Tax=Aliivibrio wodanis TaxID=80852 RepID=A0A090K1P4_9GAMM|nr:hypothetical protein AWOD_II_1044 [Aliivibrio wodanis]
MSDAILWELLIMVPGYIFAGYTIAWSVPGVIMSATVSLGSFKHIIFIDKQLAKDLDKHYDKNGHMQPQYKMSCEIGSRYFDYWIKRCGEEAYNFFELDLFFEKIESSIDKDIPNDIEDYINKSTFNNFNIKSNFNG